MKRLRLFSRCFYHVRARPWPTNDVNRFLSAKLQKVFCLFTALARYRRKSDFSSGFHNGGMDISICVRPIGCTAFGRNGRWANSVTMNYRTGTAHYARRSNHASHNISLVATVTAHHSKNTVV